MYRARTMGTGPLPAILPAALLAVGLVLGIAGCGPSDEEDLAPTFDVSHIADRSYTQGLAIDPATLPEATGGDGALTYAISPDLPAGLAFDAATRTLSGTPAASQAATLYTYTATDSDMLDPDSASLTFRMTVEAVASVSISAEVAEVSEGDDRTPVAVTLTLSEAVTGDVTVALASIGSARLGSDFDLAAASLTVAEGSTHATTTVTPIRDLEAEGNETVTLAIDSVGGRGEIGLTSSVDITVQDLGAPPPEPEGDYAAFETLLVIFSLGVQQETIEADALNFTVLVSNTGTAAASPTEALLSVTTDLLSPGREVGSLSVHALPPEGWFLGEIRVPSSELASGTSFFILRVEPVREEDPDLVASGDGGAVDFSGFFLGDDGRVRTACTGFARDTEPGTPDPLFDHQWSLRNTGQASFAARGGVAGEDLRMTQTLAGGPTGKSVQVAVVDSGLEICHPDLAANVEPGRSYNFNASIWHGAQADDPFLPTVLGDHGTSVAGLIAAAADNGVGGRGVAPGARLRGFNWLGAYDPETAVFAAHGMSAEDPKSDDVDIFNMSYGIASGAENLDEDLVEMFRSGVTDLRDGRGALYVKAAGNEFDICTEVDELGRPVAPSRLDLSLEIGCVAANLDGEHSLPYVIVVGGFSADGKRSVYSSAGSTLWVVAPAGDDGVERPAMITTDQMGCARLPDEDLGLGCGTADNPLGDYTSAFSGTSAAVPNAAGAVALLLEANPDLTWRDVKHILATTARQLDADIPRVRVAFGGVPAVLQHGWITNAAGYRFHNGYGFGAIDVDAAVALASTYTPDSLGVFIESDRFRLATAVTIPDHDGGGLTQTQNVVGLPASGNIEAVQLRLEVEHARPRDLGVELTSPAGTRSIINPVFNDALLGVENPLDWTILSNAFYGEPPTGEWTLNVIDAAEGDIGTLDAWSLIFYLGEH